MQTFKNLHHILTIILLVFFTQSSTAEYPQPLVASDGKRVAVLPSVPLSRSIPERLWRYKFGDEVIPIINRVVPQHPDLAINASASRENLPVSVASSQSHKHGKSPFTLISSRNSGTLTLNLSDGASFTSETRNKNIQHFPKGKILQKDKTEEKQLLEYLDPQKQKFKIEHLAEDWNVQKRKIDEMEFPDNRNIPRVSYKPWRYFSRKKDNKLFESNPTKLDFPKPRCSIQNDLGVVLAGPVCAVQDSGRHVCPSPPGEPPQQSSGVGLDVRLIESGHVTVSVTRMAAVDCILHVSIQSSSQLFKKENPNFEYNDELFLNHVDNNLYLNAAFASDKDLGYFRRENRNKSLEKDFRGSTQEQKTMTVHSGFSQQVAKRPEENITSSDEVERQYHEAAASSCWEVVFPPTPGWSSSVLRVTMLPYASAGYTVAVTCIGDRTELLAYQHLPSAGINEKPALVVFNSGHPPPAPLYPYSDVDELTEIDSYEDTDTSPFPNQSQDNYIVVRPEDNIRFYSSTKDQNGSSVKNFQYYTEFSSLIVDYAGLPPPHKGTPPVRRGRRSPPEDCLSCAGLVSPSQSYNATTATYTLSLTYPCSGECCQHCQVVVEMLQYQHSVGSHNCSSLPITHATTSMLYGVAEQSLVSAAEPFHIKLRTGCYLTKLQLPTQMLFGFTWLQPLTEPPDPNDWNTTFYLEPRPQLREVEVRWTESKYPYNFSHYSLQLWYQEHAPLNCSGFHVRHAGELLEVQPTPAVPLDEPRGVLTGLSPGWYCARVTPTDPRCPRDGCAVRASHTIRLHGPPPPLVSVAATLVPDESPTASYVMGLALGLTAVCLTVGPLVAFLARRYRKRREAAILQQVGYSKVSGRAVVSRPVLLLFWTSLRDPEGHVAVAVTALRNLLDLHCSVWDYHDMQSLPLPEREKLLENPTGWLHATVRHPGIKVVLVDSAGAGEWQRAVMGGSGPPTPDTVSNTPVSLLGNILFPALLQIIQQSAFLMADYSKVFVVRFCCTRKFNAPVAPLGDDATSHEMERYGECQRNEDTDAGWIRGVVQGRLYRLPLHLRAFTLALHSLSCDSPEAAALPSYSPALLENLDGACDQLQDGPLLLPAPREGVEDTRKSSSADFSPPFKLGDPLSPEYSPDEKVRVGHCRSNSGSYLVSPSKGLNASNGPFVAPRSEPPNGYNRTNNECGLSEKGIEFGTVVIIQNSK